MKWFRDGFSGESYPELDKAVRDTPTGLLIMPHFVGAAAPCMAPCSRAAVIGLNFEHTKYDIYKGMYRGNRVRDGFES